MINRNLRVGIWFHDVRNILNEQFRTLNESGQTKMTTSAIVRVFSKYTYAREYKHLVKVCRCGIGDAAAFIESRVESPETRRAIGTRVRSITTAHLTRIRSQGQHIAYILICYVYSTVPVPWSTTFIQTVSFLTPSTNKASDTAHSGTSVVAVSDQSSWGCTKHRTEKQ